MYKKVNLNYIVIFFITVILFHFTYHLKALNPTNINWLLVAYHDWGTHYLGWAFYKNEPWTFPIGAITNYNYPNGTNIGFTDSIPLMALIFKPFAFLLPDDFQYFGIWLFFCFFLTGIYSFKIFELYKVKRYISLVAVVFLMANPVLIYRGLHPALCAHWLIVASMYYYLKESNLQNAKSNNISQIIILALSALITPYLTAMVVGFNIILPLKNYFFDKSIKLKDIIIFPVVSILSILIIWYALGMIGIGESTNLASFDAFSIFSFNLNSFYNSYGYYSHFLPALELFNEKQYEGFAYFGLGIILLIIIVFVYFSIFELKKLKKNPKLKGYLIISLLTLFMLIFAITNEVTLGKEVLFKYNVPKFIETLGFIFRASGRFVWPFYYLVIIFSILIFTKIRIKFFYKFLTLIFLLGIQIYDTNNLITARTTANNHMSEFHTKLSDDKWIAVLKEFKEMITYPPFEMSMNYNLDYQDLSFLAMKSKLPITSGYVARVDAVKTQNYKDSLNYELGSGRISNDQIFVTTLNHLNNFNMLIYKKKVNLMKMDNFIFLYSKNKKFKNPVVSSTKDRKSIDSILTLFDKPSFKAFEGNISDEKAIKFYIEKYSFENNILRMDGWAFLNATKDNSKDSIFVVLKRGSESYKSPSTLSTRGDITAAYKTGKLDNSGFKSLIFAEKLKGAYEIWLEIKDSKGKSAYSNTNNTIEIETSKPEDESIDMKYGEHISLNLENFSPIFSKYKKGLVFFSNGITKSKAISLKSGKYKISVGGQSTPETPINNENAHFRIKINGREIGEFYLSEKANIQKDVYFELNENTSILLELLYDNDYSKDGKDRNAVIKKIELFKI